MENTKVSIVIPVYNEETNIKKGVVDKMAAYLKTVNYTYEVLFVDDGSTDQTEEILTNTLHIDPNFKIIKDLHTGKAFTIIRGMQEAKGSIVLTMDMDLATPLDEFEKMLPYFEKDYDVVIGSRGHIRRNAPLSRRFLSKMQYLIRGVLLDLREITDTQCGFKAYKKDVIEAVLPKLYLYNPAKAKELQHPSVAAGFDVEFLFVAKRLGFNIKSVPVYWNYKLSNRVNLLRDAIKGLLELIALKKLELLGKYSTKKTI